MLKAPSGAIYRSPPRQRRDRNKTADTCPVTSLTGSMPSTFCYARIMDGLIPAHTSPPSLGAPGRRKQRLSARNQLNRTSLNPPNPKPIASLTAAPIHHSYVAKRKTAMPKAPLGAIYRSPPRQRWESKGNKTTEAPLGATHAR